MMALIDQQTGQINPGIEDDFLRARAEAERRQWHRDRGLPVPGEEMVRGFVPDWGSSGDSFRRG